MADLKFEIIKKIGVLSETEKGWKKEINLVKWNDFAPKYDLRDWNEDHTRMGKGITLTEDELNKLRKGCKMEENFKDILDSINTLHKKYRSKEYLETIEHFNRDSKDLVKILEKYKVNENKSKENKIKKTKQKVNLKKNYEKNNHTYKKIEAMS